MDERSVSLSFSLGGDYYETDKDDHSVAIFTETGGIGFVTLGIVYLLQLEEYINLNPEAKRPLFGKDPQTVIVDFIRAISRGKRVTGNYTLHPSTMYGPDTDLGHYVLHTRGDAVEHYTDTPWPDVSDRVKMLRAFKDDPNVQLSAELSRVTRYIIGGMVDEPREEDL